MPGNIHDVMGYPFKTSKYGSLAFTHYNAFTVGRDDYGHDVKFFGDTSGKYVLWDASADTLEVAGTLALSGAQQIVGSLDMDGSIDADYTGTATRAYDFQTVVGATMASAVDKQFLYVRSDLDGGWDEDVSGGDGYTVGMFRAYVGASAGGLIAEGLRAGVNLDAGVIVSDGAGAGYIAGARFTTYVPATANAKTNKGVIIAPRDDTAVAAIAGSQYIGAQIYLMQATAKAESWGLDIYTESGCATLDAAINIRNGGTEVYTSGIDFTDGHYGTILNAGAHAAAAATKGIVIGASSSTFGSGIPLSAVNYQGSGLFFDDGGVALTAGSTEGLMVRYVVTQAIAGGIDVSGSAFHASMWLRANYTGVGGFSGVWGQFSVPTGVTVDTSGGTGDVAGGHFSINIPSGATLAASSNAAGASVGGNLGGTLTGAVSGFVVRPPSAGQWTHLYYAPAAAVALAKRGLVLGVDQNAAGGGIPLSASNYQAHALYSDDGGVALTAGYTECFTARHLITTAITGGIDVSATAIHGDMHVRANYTGGGGMSGVWGIVSVPTGVTIDCSGGLGDFAGGHFSVDVPSGATLAASSWGAGVSVGGNLGGTTSGLLAGLRIRTPSAGTWDAAISLGGASDGTTQGSAAGVTQDTHLKVYVGTELFTIPMYSAA